MRSLTVAMEVCLTCDGCSKVIHAAKTAAKVKAEARLYDLYRRVRGRDLCVGCVKQSKP